MYFFIHFLSLQMSKNLFKNMKILEKHENHTFESTFVSLWDDFSVWWRNLRIFNELGGFEMRFLGFSCWEGVWSTKKTTKSKDFQWNLRIFMILRGFEMRFLGFSWYWEDLRWDSTKNYEKQRKRLKTHEILWICR